MNSKDIYKLFLQFPSAQTDTRELKTGDIFFALKGPNFNGNQFAKQALDAGAAYVVADEELPLRDERIIQVNDVLQTLQELAKHHRNQFDIPFIAITGSNGKTTTKELLHEVLSTTFKTYTTVGNLNNHIGIPLTILKIKPDAEMAVIEMGANHLHEIAGYCDYVQPTHGLITNIGKAHLEGFGSLEGVKKGKGELFKYLQIHNGVAFVNKEDDAVFDLSKGIKNVVFYGKNETAIRIQNDPFLEVSILEVPELTIQSKLTGSYNAPNLLAAVSIGRYFKINDDSLKKAIENYTPSNNRSQLIKKGSNIIVLDDYNANPSSMKVAIENIASMQGNKKILILGDMKELGNESRQEHEAIIALIDKFKWNAVVLVGNNFGEIGHQYIHFQTSNEAKGWYMQENIQDAQILIKGSRSMQMEKVLK